MKVISGLLIVFSLTFLYIGCKEGDTVIIPDPPVFNPTHIFSKTAGSNQSDIVTGVCQAGDGGVVICGYTIASAFGDNDIFIIKLDNTGNIVFSNVYGGLGNDQASYIEKTSDNGFIIGGTTNTFSGSFDPIAIKMDASGTIVWSKYYRWWNDDYGNCITQTSDGGYIMTGNSNSFGAGDNDIYSLKLDQSGSIMWCRCYGGAFADFGSAIRQTPDAGYIIGGNTFTYGQFGDAFIVKLYGDGALRWAKTYGGGGFDGLSDLQTASNGFIACGSTGSFGLTNQDALVFNIDNQDGFVYWARTFGGSSGAIDNFSRLYQTSEGGIVLAGYMDNASNTGMDISIVKLYGDGAFNWQKLFGGAVNDNGTALSIKTDGGFLVAGPTASFGAGSNDVYLQSLKSDGTGCLTDNSVTPVGGNPTLDVVAQTPQYFDVNFFETNSVTLSSAPFNMILNTQCTANP